MLENLTNKDILLRDVCDFDMKAICDIYADEVLNGVSSWEEEPPSLAEMIRRRDNIISKDYPYRVAERNGYIVGYTYASVYRPRVGYRYTVENTIYIDKNARGLGIGKHLLIDLVEQCKSKGYRQMVAVIGDSNNQNSIGFHTQMGFTQVGLIKNIGFKFGCWMDSVIMQLPLTNDQ